MFGKILKQKSKETSSFSELKLFNSESKKLEIFKPLNKKTVSIYSCGPTVYDYAHIGNLRSFVFADILKRTLIFFGYGVNHTINLTDFGHLTSDGDEGEDKIMLSLKKEGLSFTLENMYDLTSRYIEAFYDDFTDLRIIPPDTWSRASEYITPQIKLIETIYNKGYAYETDDGIYFDIQKFPSYGRLGNIDLNKLKSGARVEVNEHKHHPADFAIWKKGDLGWDSKWGKGFPGWHIECSAMAMTTLGKEIDIHTGGKDLATVHHNAEIAQTESVTGKKFVQYWLHSEFVSIDNTKISKSLGNTINLRHLYDRGFSGDDYRYFLLSAHYRSPINFSWDNLKASKQALFRLKRFVYEDYKGKAGKPNQDYVEKFKTFLADDLDTPQVLALLFEVTKDRTLDDKTKCATIQTIDKVLALGLSEKLEDGAKNLGVVSLSTIPAVVRDLVNDRELARATRNWVEADRLREMITLNGYEVDDTPRGPKLILLQKEKEE